MAQTISQECLKPCHCCRADLPYFHTVELSLHPCIEALASGMLDIVKLMEEYGCQLHKNVYALGFAVRANQVEVVEYLLINYKYPLNYEYVGPWNCRLVGGEQLWNPHNTLIRSACNHKSGDMVKVLLDHDADPNIKHGQCISAINVAISREHVEVMARYIRTGVSVTGKSFSRSTWTVVCPLEAAVWNPHIGVVQMLLVSGSQLPCGVFNWPKDTKSKDDIPPYMQELLEEWDVYRNNVLPLKQRCRMVILNHLCPQADKKITELPLPPFLIRYLSIPELDDILEAFKTSPPKRKRRTQHKC